MEFEGFRLLASFEETRRYATGRGWEWRVPVPAEDQQEVLLLPREGALASITLGFERSVLIRINVTYNQPDPHRADALRREYPRTQHHEARSGVPAGPAYWAMTDQDRQTLVTITDDGRELYADHAARAADQADVKRAFELHGL